MATLNKKLDGVRKWMTTCMFVNPIPFHFLTLPCAVCKWMTPCMFDYQFPFHFLTLPCGVKNGTVGQKLNEVFVLLTPPSHSLCLGSEFEKTVINKHA